MTTLAFLKSTKAKVILGTVAALHLTIYFAKPSLFRQEKRANEAPPKYLP